VEISLSRYCGEKDVITTLSPEDEKIRRKLGVYPKNYFVPFWRYRIKDFVRLFSSRKLLVYYNHIFASEIKRIIGSKKWRNYFTFCFERNPWEKVISQYYYWCANNKHQSIDAFIRSKNISSNFEQYSIHGEICVDHIGKYEFLLSELEDICRKLNIPFDGWLPQAKSRYRKDHRPASQILTERQKEIIAKQFKKEIDLLGYHPEY
jgi:hypothetical protein